MKPPPPLVTPLFALRDAFTVADVVVTFNGPLQLPSAPNSLFTAWFSFVGSDNQLLWLSPGITTANLLTISSTRGRATPGHTMEITYAPRFGNTLKDLWGRDIIPFTIPINVI